MRALIQDSRKIGELAKEVNLEKVRQSVTTWKVYEG